MSSTLRIVLSPNGRRRVVSLLLAAMTVASAAELTTIQVGTVPFQVEIAQTPAERERGLMFRGTLAEDHGMLFIQPAPGPATFWMKNTYIPLDLLFFDSAGRLLEVQADLPPCTTPDCPLYTSRGAVRYILELNAGSAQRLGLRPGAPLTLTGSVPSR